jgi:hypothetical protein
MIQFHRLIFSAGVEVAIIKKRGLLDMGQDLPNRVFL